MLHAILHRLTYANVCATLALFLALGGVGYAATRLPANSVGTRQIKSKAVTKTKLDPKLISSLRGKAGATGPAGTAGSPGPAGMTGAPGPAGPAGTPDGYTRTQADQRFAQAAGGHVVSASATLAPDDFRSALLSVPGLGDVRVACLGGPAIQTGFDNTSGKTLAAVQRKYLVPGAAVDVQAVDIATGGSAAQYFAPGSVLFDLLVSAGGAGPVATVQIFGTSLGPSGNCRFTAQATVSDAG